MLTETSLAYYSTFMIRFHFFELNIVLALGSVVLSGCVAAVVGGTAVSVGGASNAVQKSLWANPRMFYSIEEETVIRIEARSFSTNMIALNNHQQAAAYLVGEELGCKSVNLIDSYAKGVPVILDLTGPVRQKTYINYYRCSNRFDDGRKARFRDEHLDLFNKIEEKQMLQAAIDDVVTERAVTGIAKYGEPNEEIGLAQELLEAHGYQPGPIDGVYGTQTAQALREYQKDRNLRVTGTLGESTRKSLFGD